MLANPRLVIRPFARREAVLSSRIEGTTAGIEDLVLYELEGEAFGERPDDTKEVSNYLAALDLGLALVEQMPVCNRLVQAEHERLLRGVCGQERRPGEFRHTQNAIGTCGIGLADVRCMPPPVQAMRQAMADLERYIGTRPDGLPLLVQLALIHYQFEAIHPFMDGNGRVGRLLIPLLLHERQHLLQPLLYLSPYIDRHRDEYNDLLLAVSQTAAWEEWIVFFLRGVTEQARESVTIAGHLVDLREHYRDLVTGPQSAANLLRLVDALFETPALTVRSARERLEVTTRPAAAMVDRLVELGLLREVTGRSYGRVFLAQELIALTEAAPDPQLGDGDGNTTIDFSPNTGS